MNKNDIDIALSEISHTVLFTQFSQWYKGQIIVGVRITAGKDQFSFYLGRYNRTVESKDHAKPWKPYQRKEAIKKNTELENELKVKF